MKTQKRQQKKVQLTVGGLKTCFNACRWLYNCIEAKISILKWWIIIVKLMIHYLTVDQSCWCNMRFLYSWSMPSFYSFSNVTQRDKSIFAEGQAWGITKSVYAVTGILVVTVVFHFKMTLFPYLVQIHLWGWGEKHSNPPLWLTCWVPSHFPKCIIDKKKKKEKSASCLPIYFLHWKK